MTLKRNILHLILFLCTILSSCSHKGAKDNYSYDLIAVQSEDKWGYIDKDGKYVINPQFNEAYLFTDGLALVQSQEGKYGYIGPDGKFLINATFKGATGFSEGLAFVTNDNGFPTCIDESGNIKFELKEVSQASSFKEGLACIEIKNKWGYIDETGKVVITPQFDDSQPFSEGFAAVASKDKAGELVWGFIDKSGKILINPQFKTAYNFVNGKALVNDGKKYGYIDDKGLYTINPQFDQGRAFSEGLAAVKQGELWGFISEDGKISINPQFEQVSSFKNGLAAVRSGKDNWGYIDLKGKYAINPQFKGAGKFYSNFTPVLTGDKYGFIDKDGKYLINPQFSNITISPFNSDLQFWPELNEYINSDYFDMTEILKTITDKGEKAMFANVNSETTLADIIDNPTYKGKLKEYSDVGVINSNGEEVTSDLKISNVVILFSKPIYSNVTNYYYGYATGSQKKFNYSAAAKDISFSMELNQFGKGNNKAHLLAESLQKELIKKYGGSAQSPKNNDQAPSAAEREAMERAVQDSIAAVEAAMAAEAAAQDQAQADAQAAANAAGKKVKYDRKTFFVYSKTFDFEIESDGVNNLTLKVIFKSLTNS
jgi:hypothetical protein